MEHFTEYDLAFAAVSETWFVEVPTFDNVINELKHRSGLHAICANRKSSQGRNTGGGVAIIYRKKLISLKTYPFRRDGCEVVITRGRLPHNFRQVFIIAIYLPPNLTVRRRNKYGEVIHDVLDKIKTEERDPIIIMAGDVNRFDLAPYTADFLDIEKLNCPPSRSGQCLDEVHTNIPRCLRACSALSPLENESGGASDHSIILVELAIEQRHDFDWIVYYARDRKKKNLDEFLNRYAAINWEDLLGDVDDPSDMVRILHEKTDELNDDLFPLRRRKIKTTDDPWINEEIKKAIRRRKRRFKRHKRGPQWRIVKSETDDLIKASKREYYDSALMKLKADGSNQLPYNILRELAIPDRPSPWTVNQTNPSLTDQALAEALADFFVRITDEFTPIDGVSYPTTYSRPFELLEPHEVARLIKSAKTPKTGLPGDVLPCLAKKCADLTAIPACRIINYSLSQLSWPADWKMETQTAIPKKDGAETFDQLRNLSCTNALSKVMESVVLERLLEEICLKSNQYGGLKGSGTTHFLVNMWDKIMRGLEEPNCAVGLMSVDFSKAFNRVDHATCLRSLAAHGASTETIGMISAFLTDRKMRFKVNNQFSTERAVKGGSPQGTRLGNLLFIITIDNIEDPTADASLSPELAGNSDENEGGMEPNDESFDITPRQRVGRVGAVRRFDSGVAVSSTPHKTNMMASVLRYDDESGRDLSLLQTSPSPEADTNPHHIWHDKYVDDVNAGETLPITGATLLLSQNKERRILRSRGCESSFATINQNAACIGMKVNPAKTQLLCVSGATHVETTSFIETGHATIKSQESMTILGFAFNHRPNVDAHMDLIRNKFNSRAWLIRHLKRAGIDNRDVRDIYRAVVRSAIEYAVPAFHSLLTVGQSQELESMQRRALKSIYGYKTSYELALEMSGLERLDLRRNNIVRKFAHQTAKNPSYSHWFPPHSPSKYDLRRKRAYLEETARTERLKNSPIFAMRRILNE